MKKKILLICNDSNAVVNFRKELILYLKNNNYNVFLIAGDDIRSSEITDIGAAFTCIPFSNRSKGIISSFNLVRKFKKEIIRIKPDIVFTFQIKPNIFGTRAAKKAGINSIFCMIEGLGDPFQPKNLKGKMLRLLVSYLYKKSLKHSKKAFVLNNDDRNELIERKIVSDKKLILIHGIGIDTKRYIPDFEIPQKKQVVNFSRLIINKGIYEYCEIAKRVRESRPDITFLLCGSEAQLTIKNIENYINDGTIIYRGYVNDTSSIFKESRLVVSTSHREGFPRVIMEAMSYGRAVIATNVIGNREAVKNNKTGYLIKLGDIESFATKILEIIDNDVILSKLGKESRSVCEREYDSNAINSQILKVIESK